MYPPSLLLRVSSREGENEFSSWANLSVATTRQDQRITAESFCISVHLMLWVGCHVASPIGMLDVKNITVSGPWDSCDGLDSNTKGEKVTAFSESSLRWCHHRIQIKGKRGRILKNLKFSKSSWVMHLFFYLLSWISTPKSIIKSTFTVLKWLPLKEKEKNLSSAPG